MLVNFSVENYRSIKKRETLSLVSGRERRSSERLTSIKKQRSRLVPMVMIQGKNGAGKSNIIKALSCALSTIRNNPQLDEKLGAVPFKLCSECLTKPSVFSFVFVVEGETYCYEFSITRDDVQSETLTWIKTKTSSVLFSRMGQTVNASGLVGSEQERNDLRIIAQGTRRNQLFLNVIAQQAANVGEYSWSHTIKSIFAWLTKDIVILTPTMNKVLNDKKSLELLSKVIPLFDTGVNSVNLVELHKDAVDMPVGFENVLSVIPEGVSLTLPGGSIFIKKVQGEVHFYEVNTNHANDKGAETAFRLDEESDGTIRLMTVLTFLNMLSEGENGKTVIVDEIDRSLHTTLTEKLISDFLKWVALTHKGQLIFTSHDSRLIKSLDLRRDEMWLVDKDASGATKLYSMAERNAKSSKDSVGLRVDKDLMELYLKGELGAIAKLKEENYFLRAAQ